MPDNKTNVIIQCRFSSSRLPGKAMYPLCGTPLLVFLIRRMKQGLPEKDFRIILATTLTKQDNPAAAWADYEGVFLIRGPQDDVLARHIRAVSQYPADINVRVTADNPLTCPIILQKTVSLLQKKKLDYVQTKNFPYGTGVDVFLAPLLNRLDRVANEPSDREHINNYVLNHPDQFKTETIHAEGALARPELNMTVDTLQDFNRVSTIFHNYNDILPWTIPLETAIKRLSAVQKSENGEINI